MQVILSIKPEFALKIFEGTKKFEFRRALFKNRKVEKVIVYASSPISKIIGEFDIKSIKYDELSSLWEETAEFSGISEEYYLSYFKGKESGYAIEVKNARQYKKKQCIKESYGIKAPQSFAYVK